MPATKATPKELLPVIDTPLIQYAIEEARDAGVERMIFVSHPSKSAIERHVRDDVGLREMLRGRGKTGLEQRLKDAAIDEQRHDVVFVMQDEPLGLGHAVLLAHEHVLPGPVAVILPDDLILGGRGCLAEMIDAYASCDSGHLVAAMDVDPETVSSYGILSPLTQEGAFVKSNAIVEKPSVDEAPSNSAVVGRYILHPDIFDALSTQEAGAGGEIQLTDAIARGIAEIGLSGFRFSGIRFDCGSKRGMLAAALHIARRDPDLAPVLSEFLDSAEPGRSDRFFAADKTVA
ncbi:sugar phosphate nucleotidyltransferase [Sulfitobacter sp. D35]|uniref:UTP--glucose-1-phosphate uridylyltransferase n=1 Tax=Sulfitobacter sp. D35 TaxID=3083252 RepID=UPI00296FDC11|nr:sugar phosphate nucleotidyltransferase [Sulfitobacter sp. D35]MDW4499891.1 sugar phosphate nucleotidyltransferase [Sulfitobacter sp. D35]